MILSSDNFSLSCLRFNTTQTAVPVWEISCCKMCSLFPSLWAGPLGNSHICTVRCWWKVVFAGDTHLVWSVLSPCWQQDEMPLEGELASAAQIIGELQCGKEGRQILKRTRTNTTQFKSHVFVCPCFCPVDPRGFCWGFLSFPSGSRGDPWHYYSWACLSSDWSLIYRSN